MRRTLLHGQALNQMVGGRALAPLLRSSLTDFGLRALLLLAAFEILYLGSYYCGNTGSCLAGMPGAPIWIPDALLLSALLVTPRRQWWIFLLALLPLRMIPQLTGADLPLWVLLANYVNDGLKAIVTASFLKGFAGGTACFFSVDRFVLYLGCAVFAVPALSAVGGAAVLHSMGVTFGIAWRNWFLGDALANLVLTPAIVLWLTIGLKRAREASLRRYAEAILLLAGLTVAAQMVFASRMMRHYQLTLLYVPLPFLLWAALRFGPLGASSALSLTAMIAIWGALHDLGPFSTLSPSQIVLSMQLFLGTISVPLLFLAVLNHERQASSQALELSERRYRAFFELNAIGAAEVDLVEGRYLRTNNAYCRLLGYSRDELLTRTFKDISYPEDLEEDLRQFSRLVRGEIPSYQLEKRFIRKDGSIVWGQLTTTLIRDGAGRPVSEMGLVLDVTKRKHAEQEVQRLATRLLHVQDEERRRIARELHDETAQALVASNLNLTDLLETPDTLDPAVQSRVRESLALSSQVLEALRTLSYVLHPPLLDELGLASALAWYVDGFSKRSGIAVELSTPEDLDRLPASVETALFRVVQESLTNIHRHAASERAWIRLETEDGRMTLEVRDQGHGMGGEGKGGDESVALLGVGIAGMRQRMQQLGGELALSSSPSGTTVTAVVPLDGAMLDD